MKGFINKKETNFWLISVIATTQPPRGEASQRRLREPSSRALRLKAL